MVDQTASRPITAGGSPDAAAQVLANATGLDLDRARELLPAVSAGLRAAQCTNVNRIAMWLALCGHESDNFSTTEEYQDGPLDQERWIYKGRSWIQLTWKSNYAAFGRWAADQGFIDDPDYFVNNPTALAELKWAGLGAAWYWTVVRPDINRLSDKGDVEGITRISSGYVGLEDRIRRRDLALAQGDGLLTLLNVSTEGGD